MVKKKELKQRAIYVYPPAEMSERWKELAEAARTSISKFVIEHVENSLRFEEDRGDYKMRAALVQENRRLLETVRDKDKRIDQLDMLVDTLQRDLRLQQERLFTEPDFVGVRNYDKRIVEILREPGPHTADEIVTRLGIQPRNVDSIRALSAQLESLQQYGLIKPSSLGYSWVE